MGECKSLFSVRWSNTEKQALYVFISMRLKEMTVYKQTVKQWWPGLWGDPGREMLLQENRFSTMQWTCLGELKCRMGGNRCVYTLAVPIIRQCRCKYAQSLQYMLDVHSIFIWQLQLYLNAVCIDWVCQNVFLGVGYINYNRISSCWGGCPEMWPNMNVTSVPRQAEDFEDVILHSTLHTSQWVMLLYILSIGH